MGPRTIAVARVLLGGAYPSDTNDTASQGVKLHQAPLPIPAQVVSIAGIGAFVAYRARQPEEEPGVLADHDPFLSLAATPSQKATYKYFVVVAALVIAQIALGIVTAHYGVEGSGLYGIPLAKLANFWIATAWLATGLYLAPSIGGAEPRFQRLGVNVRFVCLLIIVVGSLAGEWLSVQQRLGGDLWYWFGHQGYAYVDLGRFWQIFLFAGLFIWLGLMLRAFWPALMPKDEARPLLVLLRS